MLLNVFLPRQGAQLDASRACNVDVKINKRWQLWCLGDVSCPCQAGYSLLSSPSIILLSLWVTQTYFYIGVFSLNKATKRKIIARSEKNEILLNQINSHCKIKVELRVTDWGGSAKFSNEMSREVFLLFNSEISKSFLVHVNIILMFIVSKAKFLFLFTWSQFYWQNL